MRLPYCEVQILQGHAMSVPLPAGSVTEPVTGETQVLTAGNSFGHNTGATMQTTINVALETSPQHESTLIEAKQMPRLVQNTYQSLWRFCVTFVICPATQVH